MTGCFHLRVVKQTKHHVLVKSVVQGVKGTVHVISSNLLFKEGLLRCTTVPLKPLTGHLGHSVLCDPMRLTSHLLLEIP